MVVVASLGGRARVGQIVSVTWSGLVANQVNNFWVKVDSGEVILESNDGDNVMSGIVIADPDQLFLPQTTR